MSVKYRKKSNSYRCHPKRGARGEKYQKTKHNAGKSDSSFNGRNRHSENTQRASQRHHHWKNNRQQPYRWGAQECTPEAHCDHCHDVVQTEKGMSESADQSRCSFAAGMSVGIHGTGAEQKAGEKKVNEVGCFAQPKTGAGDGLREGEGCHKKGVVGVVSPAALNSSAGIIFDNLSEHKMFLTKKKQEEKRIF